MDAPERPTLLAAVRKLYFLEALDDMGRLTQLGDLMSQFPIAPELARALIVSSRQFSCSKEMIAVVSMLSSEDVFYRPRNPNRLEEVQQCHEAWFHSTGDHITLLQIFIAFCQQPKQSVRDWCREHHFNYRSLKNAREVDRQLKDIMVRMKLDIQSCLAPSTHWRQIPARDVVPVLKSLLTSFYTNIAKRQVNRPLFYHYASTSSHSALALPSPSAHEETKLEHQVHGTVNLYLLALTLHPTSALLMTSADGQHVVRSEVDWVMYHDIVYTNRAHMRHASKILFEWAEQGGLVQRMSDSAQHRSVDVVQLATGIRSTKVQEVSDEQPPTIALPQDTGNERKRKSSVEDDPSAREQAAAEARARYLQRKREREQLKRK